MNVHVYPSTIENESRMLKIADSLAKAGVFSHIELVGRWREGLPRRARINDNVEIVRIKPTRLRLLGRRAERVIAVVSWYLKTVYYLLNQDITCINPHSLPVLPLAVLIKLTKGSKLIYDTHELETETISCKGTKKILYKVTEKVFLRFTDAICVVNRSIANWYSTNYGISTPFVVKNVPHRQPYDGKRSTALRDLFKIPLSDIVFLYQGLLSEGRGLRLTIEAFKGKKDKHIVFMGYGELAPLIQAAAEQNPNIHYKSAVPPEMIPSITPSADAGLSLIENKCLSYYLCLPNKVYEYLNSGVPVIASDFPEMNHFVQDNRAGWTITPTIKELSTLLEELTKESLENKRNEILEGNHSFGWHLEESNLLQMYQTIGFKRKNT